MPEQLRDASGNVLTPAVGQPGVYFIAGTTVRATPVNQASASGASSAAAVGTSEPINFGELGEGKELSAPTKISPELAAALLGVPVVGSPQKNTNQINFKTAAERLGYELVDSKNKSLGKPSATSTKSPLVADYFAGRTELPDNLGRGAVAESLAKDFLNTYATSYYTAKDANTAPAVGYIRDQILTQGYGPAIQNVIAGRSEGVNTQPFFSSLRSDPEFKPFSRAIDLYSTYIPQYQPSVTEIARLGDAIQNSSFNRAKGQFLSNLTTDPRYAEAYVGSPAARERGPLGYEPVEFTGIAGLQTDTPEYLAAREAVKTNVAKSLLGTAPPPQTFGQTGRVAGAVPMGYAGEVGREAPDVYAGVPAAEARPLANMSPADFAAQDIAANIAENRAAGYRDIYGNSINAPTYGSPIDTTGGLASLTADQVAAAQMAAAQEAQAVADAQGQTAAAAPTASTPVSMREGGVASLADDAEAVRGAGRYGDDRLVHVNSEELGIMQGIFGKPTINPKTGLPEFFLGKIFKGIKKVFKKVLKVAAKIIPFVAPFIPVGPLAQAGIAGLAGAFQDGKFNLKRGLMSGLLSFGTGQALSGLKAAGGAGSAASSAASQAANVADDALAAGVSQATTRSAAQALAPQAAAGSVLASQAPRAAIGAAVTPQVANAATTPLVTNLGQSAVQAIAPAVTPSIASAAAPSLVSQIGSNIVSGAQQAGTGLKNLITNQPGALDAFKNEFGTGSALALSTGASGIQALDEQQAFEEEQRRLQEDEERRQRENIDFFRRNTVPFEFSAAQGGEVDDEPGYDMARGGKVLPPRYLSGGGDGMSDSIPATIAGKRPARLADGEFVIPADVVSHLGNGSSKAGAKRLYDMMDRVRKARTGTKRQGREINPMRMMPA